MKLCRQLAFLLLFLPFTVSGQVYEFGIESFINNNWLVNQNVLDAGNQQGMVFTLDYSFGGYGVMYFSGANAVTLGVNGGRFKQEYSGFDEVGGFPRFYKSETSLSQINIPVGYRLGMNDFFEVGVQTTLINSAEHLFRDSNGEVITDVSDNFESVSFGFFAGFGSNAEITDKILISTGMRFSYGFSDIGGVDAYGNNLNDTSNPALYDPSADQGLYAGYEATNAISVGFRIGVVYRIVPESK